MAHHPMPLSVHEMRGAGLKATRVHLHEPGTDSDSGPAQALMTSALVQVATGNFRHPGNRTQAQPHLNVGSPGS
jgi:hypothetical protein